MKRRLVIVCALALASVTAVTVGFAPGASDAAPASAAALEAAILAPCCYGGTLATHESDIAHDLREEIESRVAKGESTAAIEADLVSRYGPQVVAIHPRSFTWATVITLDAVIAAAFGMVLLLMRWRASTPKVPDNAPVPSAPRDAYDDRLDEELEAQE